MSSRALLGSMPANTLRQQYVRLVGGLDITTPLAQATPGTLLGAENVEQRVDGGMERFPGYERYDGRARPSEAAYFEIPFDGGAVSPWTARATLPDASWEAAAYGNGVWVVAGFNAGEGIRWSNDDGATWNAATLPSIDRGFVAGCVIWDGSRFVGVTRNGQVLTSPTGATWTQVSTLGLSLFGERTGALAFSGSRYVVMLNSTNDPAKVGAVYSDDLVTWTNSTLPRLQWNGAVYAQGMFVSVCSSEPGFETYVVATSTDGVAWTQRAGVDWGSGLLVAAGNDTFAAVIGGLPHYSTDGIAWTPTTFGTPYENYYYWALIHDGSRFVAVHDDTADNAVLISEDGVTWLPIATPTAGVDWYVLGASATKLLVGGYGDNGGGFTAQLVGDFAAAAPVAAGDTVTTATGSGVVVGVNLTAGAWGYGNAEGAVAVRSVTGTFSNDQDLQESAVTFAQVDGTAQRGVAGMVDFEARQKATIEAQRALIQQVPGQGPIRGLGILNGVLHAVRDDLIGGGATVYKATSTGWQALTFDREVSFTATSIAQIAEGSTVSQTSPTRTATIKRVVLESGIWGTGAIYGRLIITAPSGGEFTAATATADGKTVTLGGASTAIGLLGGGRWRFIAHNFSGEETSLRLYGADGVNRPIEIGQDGVIVPINTGVTTPKATCIEAHRNHLFVSHGTNLQHSAIGEPYKWTVLGGASAIAAGDTINEVLSVAGSEQSAALLVLSKNSAHIVYGSSAGNWQLVMLSQDAGAMPYSMQQLGSVITVDTEGIRALAPSDVFGNFTPGNASDPIRRLVTGITPSASMLDRKRGRYRVFLADGTGFVGSPMGRGRWAWTVTRLLHTVNVAVDGEIAGEACMFFAGDSGYVYEIRDCRSMDGQNIEWFLRTSFLSMGMPTLRKAFRGVDIEVRGQSAATVRVMSDFSYGVYGTDATPIASTPVSLNEVSQTGGLWDVSEYEEIAWDSPFASIVKQRHYGVGTNMSLLIGGRSDFELPVEVIGLTVNYIPRNIER